MLTLYEGISAQQLSTPATLHTGSAHVHFICAQAGFTAASVKFMSSEKASEKITHLPSADENRNVCVTGTEAL